ncbi:MULTISPECIES: heme A synthase [unclassified Virgibacillus]|uniref:COX15/CtaA family protein n=1 Tax=unclassified Virgibacillus TaxID=2620237 RepID=UPI0024DE71A6|nr:heme A synthase [Virgibacillus sp. LDC-1]
MIKTLKSLSVVATIGMIFILMGGALVTKTESGAGCGSSWPLCHGQLIPSEITPELIIELSHRLVSGIIGVVVLGLSILSWVFIGHIREVKFLSFLSLFFLVLQGLIGAAAVMWGQSDFVLAMHFGISLISFAAVFLLTLLIFEIDQKFDTNTLLLEKKHRIEIYLLAVYTLVVVYTGALVRHTDANLVCKDWPFCFNDAPFAIMDYRFDQWIQMGHRFAAGILFIWTIIFFARLIRNYKGSKVIFWGSLTQIIFISLQVLFGALIIFTLLNLGIALLHALIISCFFAVLCYFILLASRSAAAEKQNNLRNTKNEALK